MAALTRVSDVTGRVTYYLAVLAWALGNAGRDAEARAILAELHERAGREYVGPMLFAFVHAGLRQADRAMEWLLRAELNGSPIRVWLAYPLFDNVRDDARFEQLAGRLCRP